jgi:hypothetical protein
MALPLGQLVNMGAGTAGDLFRAVGTGPFGFLAKAGTGLTVLGGIADVGITMGVSKSGERGTRTIGALSDIPAGIIGTDVGAFIGGAAGMAAGGPIGAFVGRGVGGLVGGFVAPVITRSAVVAAGLAVYDAGKRAGRPQMGGHYVDTEQAYTLRQKSAQELGRSMLNARQYLGHEGPMFHS